MECEEAHERMKEAFKSRALALKREFHSRESVEATDNEEFKGFLEPSDGKADSDAMAYMRREGRLHHSEHIFLAEAFLDMASTAEIEQQQEVFAWSLKLLRQQWTHLDWQNNYLSEPLGIVRLCSETPFMWSIFHTVKLFEKALKISGARKEYTTLHKCSTSSRLHPMASHLSWMLPPLLKLLRVIHSLWSPSVNQALPEKLKAAMSMSDVELHALLGKENPKLSKGFVTFADGSQTDTSKEGYTVLGLSISIGNPFFNCLDIDSVMVTVALVENIQSMQFRHIKQLIRLVLIYLVKSCPSEMWEVWLEKLLDPLFIHVQNVLCFSRSINLHEGKAKVPDVENMPSELDVKVDVMAEKLLRDVTHETCSLLSAMASLEVNIGLPFLEPSGLVNRMDTSSLKDLNDFAITSMVGFLLKHKGLSHPILQICLEVFSWADSEAVKNISVFCAAVVLLAILANDVEVRRFVSKDLFNAILEAMKLESNSIISANLVGLCRKIFFYLRDRDPSLRRALLSLTDSTRRCLILFEEDLTKTSSTEEQNQCMKRFLISVERYELLALNPPIMEDDSCDDIPNLSPSVMARVIENRARSKAHKKKMAEYRKQMGAMRKAYYSNPDNPLFESNKEPDEWFDSDGKHEITDEELKKYMEQLNASGGFEMGDFPNVYEFGMIQPMKLNERSVAELDKYIKMALEEFNQKENSNFECVEIEKASVLGGLRTEYYITFKAKDENRVSTFTFQALIFYDYVCEKRHYETSVGICRLKPDTAPGHGK
ncbi:protein HASTY 1-like isoform X2 [Mercurialis annua]|uniref:protein HASTY 1-like isoform X2 n=1 Tax=Mercurialis annua TaxID=3986 RepID=UPI0024AD8FB3|nr:protein HASTY 1-like isoform X2 [Mercurialis annua]